MECAVSVHQAQYIELTPTEQVTSNNAQYVVVVVGHKSSERKAHTKYLPGKVLVGLVRVSWQQHMID